MTQRTIIRIKNFVMYTVIPSTRCRVLIPIDLLSPGCRVISGRVSYSQGRDVTQVCDRWRCRPLDWLPRVITQIDMSPRRCLADTSCPST